MTTMLMPEYLNVPAHRLGEGTMVTVQVVSDMMAVAEHFAAALFNEFSSKPEATLIVPVGPVDQFPILAGRINQARLDCRGIVLINMDEYLTGDDQWLPIDHPLSFRGYMNRKFYDLLDPSLAPLPEQRVFPDPRKLQEIPELIERRGGVDTCYGGIGINGHLAFNEPSEDEAADDDAFAALPTRCLDLTPHTRTINSHTVGGELSIIPRRAVTVGMKEILGARRLRFYCNRPWQSAVIRRALHGTVTAACPASFLRRHDDAVITIADYVAQPPDIRLR